MRSPDSVINCLICFALSAILSKYSFIFLYPYTIPAIATDNATAGPAATAAPPAATPAPAPAAPVAALATPATSGNKPANT